MNHHGMSVAPTSLTKALDSVGEDFDQEFKTWKQHLSCHLSSEIKTEIKIFVCVLWEPAGQILGVLKDVFNSFSSSSECDGKEYFYEESVECCGVILYEDLEPLDTEEEATEQEAKMAQEAKVERKDQARLTPQVDVTAWYNITFLYNKVHLFILSKPYENCLSVLCRPILVQSCFL